MNHSEHSFFDACRTNLPTGPTPWKLCAKSLVLDQWSSKGQHGGLCSTPHRQQAISRHPQGNEFGKCADVTYERKRGQFILRVTSCHSLATGQKARDSSRPVHRIRLFLDESSRSAVCTRTIRPPLELEARRAQLQDGTPELPVTLYSTDKYLN